MKKKPLTLALAGVVLIAASSAASYFAGKRAVAEYFSTQKSIQEAAHSLTVRIEPNPLPVVGHEDPHGEDAKAARELQTLEEQARDSLFKFPATLVVERDVTECAQTLHIALIMQLGQLEELFDTRSVRAKTAQEFTQAIDDYSGYTNASISTLMKCSELYTGDRELADVQTRKLIPKIEMPAPAQDQPL